MQTKLNHLLIAGALASLTGLAGCASSGDLDALRAEIRDAASAASSAQSTANEAKQEAAAASATAAEAKATADEAKMMSEATDAKIDRMFKKAMYK